MCPPLGLFGCAPKEEESKDFGAAKPFWDIKGSDDPDSPNCYAYAIGSEINEQPEKRSRKSPKINNVREVGNAVISDLKSMGRKARIIDSANANVNQDEYRIALRVGTKPIPEYLEMGYIFYDYHFMVQTETGQWAEKHGIAGDAILHESGLSPDVIPWVLIGDTPYYDSEIIYFAITD